MATDQGLCGSLRYQYSTIPDGSASSSRANARSKPVQIQRA
jgi:hypothetical protein